MKRIAIINMLVACIAALLTSCIKEEPYKLETAQVDVTFNTRATSSQVQGDGISDVMIWAFKCSGTDGNGHPTDVENTASGWRYVSGLKTYQSVNVHLELPLCDAGVSKQNYLLVAVINQGQFGKIYKQSGSTEELKLGSATTWTELQNAVFDASTTEYWASLIDDSGKTPVYMPVSHWTTFDIDNTNTHPDNCKDVTMSVYRAVAKGQLYMKKMTSGFNLTVTDAKFVSNKMSKEGLVLSKIVEMTTDTPTKAPEWFMAKPAQEAAQTNRALYNSNNKPIVGTDATAAKTVTAAGESDYEFVGSTVLYETAEICEQADDNKYNAVTGDGCYLEVTYKVAEATFTKQVALPAIVRNHDYEIKATVQADGQVNVSYIVADWVEQDWVLTYDAPMNSNIMTSPILPTTPEAAPTMRFTNGTDQGAFVGYFQMTGPEGLTWQPTLTKGVKYALSVYKVLINEDNNSFTLSPDPVPTPIAADQNAWYAIKVYPLEPKDTNEGADNTVSLGITYAPKWDESATDFLIINSTQSEGGQYWPETDSEFLLKITQTDN